MKDEHEEYEDEKYADLALRDEVRKSILPILDLSRREGEPTYEELVELDKGGMLPPVEPPVPATLPSEGDKEEPGKSPISVAKLAANRANAQRSSGPKTPEGKEKSKFNAVKHGLTARFFPNILQEGTPEWLEFSKVGLLLTEHFQPVGALEQLLLQKIVVETIRYGRFIAREQSPGVLEGLYWDLTHLGTRYQSAINRQLFQAIETLECVQAARKAEERGEAEPGCSCD